MLSGDANHSRGRFLFLARPHPMFLVKLHGVIMFSEIYGVFVNDMTKICLLMIDVCIKCSESHMAGFIGNFFVLVCTGVYLYVW